MDNNGARIGLRDVMALFCESDNKRKFVEYDSDDFDEERLHACGYKALTEMAGPCTPPQTKSKPAD